MSKRLAGLKREIAALRKHFLPRKFDPLGTYRNPRRVEAGVRAFIVLSHAEIESYLEDWAKSIARATERAWKAKRITPPLVFLTGLRQFESSRSTDDCHKRLESVINRSFAEYYKIIRQNHGIKDSNLLALFDFIGVSTTTLSPTLIPSLNSFGSDRGQIAHNSRRSVIHVLDPETEYSRVQGLLKDLEPVEEWLVKYRRKIH